MELTDEQRAWLDKAIQVKGKFTTKRAVRKRMQAYLRRRTKTADATAALPSTHQNYPALQGLLKSADALAEGGKLKEAYEHLEKAKAVSRSDALGRSSTISTDDIRDTANRLARTLGEHVVACNEAQARVIDFFAVLKAAPKATECATLSDAVTFRANFVAEEVQLRATFANLSSKCNDAVLLVRRSTLINDMNLLKADIAAVKVDGRGKDVERYEAALAKMLSTWESKGGLYSKPGVMRNIMARQSDEFENHILNCKVFGKFVNREGEDVITDSKVDAVRHDLIRDDAARLALVEREEARLERARAELKILGLLDDLTFADTSNSVELVTPELPTFVPSDVFDQLSGDIVIADVISDQDSDTIAATVADKLKTFATDVGTDKHELFDLTMKTKDDLMSMISVDIFSTPDTSSLTKSQVDMLEKATKEAEIALARYLPNRIEADGSKVSIGNVEYHNPEVLKEGGNGRAVRYTDNQGNTVIVKSRIKSGDDERSEMVREMEIHMRAMEGRDPSNADDGIVDFYGAARSEDGGLFMIMEEVKGGDLSDLTNGLKAAAGLGLIPPAAREAIALGNLLDTVKALKNLERQGMVHHDLKEENVMMTADGKIKIIDFGESGFLNEAGVLDEQRGATPGYAAYDRIADTKVDNYAVSAMLQRMVLGSGLNTENLTHFNDKKMKGGVLGRLVAALSDPDPKKRPSLDAILSSSLAASYDNDYSAENVKDLQTASLDFALQSTQVQGDLDLGSLAGELSAKTMRALTDPMKLKAAQDVIEFYKSQIKTWQYQIDNDDLDQAMFKGYTEQIYKELEADIHLLNSKVVAPMLAAAISEAEDAYASDLNNTALKIDITVSGKTQNVTLKKAVEARDKIVASIQKNHDKVMSLLNGAAETQDMQDLIDRVNAQLTQLDEIRKGIDASIYDTVGPKAKLFLAKVKMENAAAPFGARGSSEFEEGVEDKSGLDQLISELGSADVRDELKEKAAT